MAWIKKNIIFKTPGNQEWSRTHTQVPTALVLEDKIRIYYATRDSKSRSLTSFIDVSRDNPENILYIHDKPVLELGECGTHDEDGVMVGCVVKKDSHVLMYYTGWSKKQTVPYRVSIGLAKSEDNGLTFKRLFAGPVVDRTMHEPYMTMSPYVIHENDFWEMWYGSGTQWVLIEGRMEPVYVIKYACSDDGIHWIQKNTTCIEALHSHEANTRPSLLKTSSGYEMWFSHRHIIDYRTGKGGYRIGYALSTDGKKWTRQPDQADLTITKDSWDSQMLAYPNVIEIENKKIMFYNGDGFGQSGFGYFIWE